MPYQGDTTPPPSTPAESTSAHSAARTVTVIPAVDLFLGMVTIITREKTVRFGHPEPRRIAQALAQAVRPTRWCEASRTLTVTVATVGKPAGLERHFLFQHEQRA